MEDPPSPALFSYLLLILSLAVDECVIARTAIARVGASAAIDGVITWATVNCLVVRAAIEGVFTRPTFHAIVPDVSGSLVRALLAVQLIGTNSAAQNVVASFAVDKIVATLAFDDIVSSATA